MAKYNAVTAKEIADWQAQYDSGKSIEQIKSNRNIQTIYRHIRTSEGHQRMTTGERYKAAYRDHLAGIASQAEISRRYGISAGSFCTFCKNGGNHTAKKNSYSIGYNPDARLNPALGMWA